MFDMSRKRLISSGDKKENGSFRCRRADVFYEVANDLMEKEDFFEWSEEEKNTRLVLERAFRITRNYKWMLEGGTL